MILIALGSNIEGRWGNPRQTIVRAVSTLNRFPLKLVKASELYDTDPFGRLNQPRFVNAVVCIDTVLSPNALIRRLHMIEREAGRRRGLRWGPRTLDLDILDYNGRIMNTPDQQLKKLVLPHPGIAVRRFVLEPLLEIAPTWRHPKTLKSAAGLLSQLSSS